MMELNGDIVPLIFLVFSVGFMCLTLPMGLLTTWAARRWGVSR
jgi:glutamate transport system permease protein